MTMAHSGRWLQWGVVCREAGVRRPGKVQVLGALEEGQTGFTKDVMRNVTGEARVRPTPSV
jgi:hypothetical protein